MKITVELLGLTSLSKAVGKSITADMVEGSCVEDLIGWMVTRYGKKASDALLDATGKVDDTIQVIVNEEGFLRRDLWKGRVLKNADVVKLMLLVGGG